MTDIRLVLGLDEVGRGSIAGPIAVGSFLIEESAHEKLLEYGVRDSKRLSPTKRRNVYYTFTQNEGSNRMPFHYSYHIEYRSSTAIDQSGISDVTFSCVEACIQRYLDQYGDQIVAIYLDRGLKPRKFRSVQLPETTQLIEAPAKGEDLYPSVAAASIMAKVERDFFMTQLGKQHPQYGFQSNSGYGSKQHYDAIKTYGPLPAVHRLSYLK